MGTCFVIQPFDKGPFDKRYEDTFVKAIKAANLEPYRVDRDPSSQIPINDIEEGIRRSDICFAEITTDNPNVWFELGFAFSARKPVVMVCTDQRNKFPFDVQHRSIIRYKTESIRDFNELANQITERLKAALETKLQIDTVENLSPTNPTSGLTQHELVGLIIISANSLNENPLTPYSFRQEMNRVGYTDVACALAIRGLEKKQYICRDSGYDGHNEYYGFIVTDQGLDWLENNQDRLKLKQEPNQPKMIEEDLPF